MTYFGSCGVFTPDWGKEFGGEFLYGMPEGEEKVGRYAQHQRVAWPCWKREQALVESFHLTRRRECLGWCKHKLSDTEESQKDVQE